MRVKKREAICWKELPLEAGDIIFLYFSDTNGILPYFIVNSEKVYSLADKRLHQMYDCCSSQYKIEIYRNGRKIKLSVST